MARNKTSKAWMQEHVTDHYVKRAQAEGMRSRAAYKLEQLAERDRLLRPGMVVVDLGAAPGGWSQVASRALGGQGRVIAVDLLEMVPLNGVSFIQGDFADDEILVAVEQILGVGGADLVLSDMAPNITGVAVVDQARSIGLAELALDFAVNHLNVNGNFLVKVFQGAGFEALVATIKLQFKQVLIRKPDASRSRSNEVYIVAKGLRSGGC
jgi:23S rRNA (uridine2552-2'-O)-methyltransferase